MQFDIAVGMREDLLNRIAREIHPQLRPVLFNQTINLMDLRLKVTFDVTEPPVFDLVPLTTNQIRTLGETMRVRFPHTFTNVPVGELEALIPMLPTVSVKFPEIKVTLVSTLDNHETELEFGATAFCRAGVNMEQGRVNLRVMHIDVANLQNEQLIFVIDHVVTPKVQDLLDQYLGSLPVPPLNLGDVPLSIPLIVIKDSRIIALANVRPKGTPRYPEGIDWPDAEMFALVSPDGLNAAANVALGTINPQLDGSGAKTKDLPLVKFTASWRYDTTLYDPQVTVENNRMHLALEAKCQADLRLKADFKFIPDPPERDLNITLNVEPNLRADVSAFVDSAHQVFLAVSNVEPFRVEASVDQLPDWAVKAQEWITGTVTEAITTAFLGVLNPAIARMRFKVYTIPEVNINVGTVHLKVVPTGVTVAPNNGMLAMTGSLEVRTPVGV